MSEPESGQRGQQQMSSGQSAEADPPPYRDIGRTSTGNNQFYKDHFQRG